MKEGIKVFLVALAVIVAFFLVLPWIVTGYESYLDWQYCQTHEYIEHSWTTNTHHCTPTRSTR